METKRACKNIHTREDDDFCEMRMVAGVWMYDCMNECSQNNVQPFIHT